ncbi:hypothetical protein AB0F03_10925 [Streptomyces sp. NPDC028722]
MKRSPGVRLGATAAMSVLWLAHVTGCGEEPNDSGDGKGKDAPRRR